jgi:hypothetical protein
MEIVKLGPVEIKVVKLENGRRILETEGQPPVECEEEKMIEVAGKLAKKSRYLHAIKLRNQFFKKLNKLIEDEAIVRWIGEWCDDTRRDIPQIYKFVDDFFTDTPQVNWFHNNGEIARFLNSGG